MVNLKPYEDVNFRGLRAIFGSKNGARHKRLLNAAPIIEAACENYSRRRRTLARIVPLNLGGHRQRDLLHCYSSKTASLDELKTNVHENQPDSVGQICQYCDITASRSIDHYLPQGEFEEFAVFSLNLVPACKDCNNLKLERWLKNGRRQFLSLYFDRLPRLRFLFATVYYVNGEFRSEFYLSPSRAVYEGMKGLVRSHFQHLQLLQRYESAAGRELSENREMAKRFARTHTQAETAQFLRDYAYSIRPAESPNYWKSSLIEASSYCHEFCSP